MLTVDDYLGWPAAPADVRHAYGAGPDQFGDLYLPQGRGPHPTLVLLHGGCWRARFGLDPLGPLCLALRAAGLAVWSLEYRRLGGGGGWPATFLDAAAGADALRELAPAHGLDLGRVLACGHSAGGHLALWLAARPRLPADSPLHRPDPLPLRGVLALAALADLAEGARRQLCGGAIDELVAGAPDPGLAYAHASPAALLPLGVPQRHIVGAEDAIVLSDYLADYVALASAAGDDVVLTVVPAAGHFEPVDPASQSWPAVLAAARELLGRAA
jgi:acetyl esterase/lipase